MLGLPNGITACLFDLDGVLTDTAAVHAAAWATAFDGFLSRRVGPDFQPFSHDDYLTYVDGKPRADGVRDFLKSRGIVLPGGTVGDPPGDDTVHAVGNAKNADLVARIRAGGVEVFPGSVRYLKAARDAGLRRAVVSSSANTADVLRVTGLEEYVELRVDGVTIREEAIPGKPAPDTFLKAAALLGVEPAHAAVFEDAIAGVRAGRDGGFGTVVGVDRVGQAAELHQNGANIVVTDLADLLSVDSDPPSEDVVA